MPIHGRLVLHTNKANGCLDAIGYVSYSKWLYEYLSNQLSYIYAKPYSQRIDMIKIPNNYQPLKFQQFDGKGNLRQHIAHFMETCNNAGTYGDLMVK